MAEVLHVDDDKQIRDIFKDFAEVANIELVQAATARDGIREMIEHPELKAVISDLSLVGEGDTSGLEVIGRALEVGKEYVVLATSYVGLLRLQKKVLRMDKMTATRWMERTFGK